MGLRRDMQEQSLPIGDLVGLFPRRGRLDRLVRQHLLYPQNRLNACPRFTPIWLEQGVYAEIKR